MERRSEQTKALLGEKFKELIIEKSFDKITIKMITDRAGVIRPTFYNYFQDKYEVMEWLLWENVFKNVSELVDMDMELEAIKMLFRKIGADKKYYKKSFEVKGQNSFEEMLFAQIYGIAEKMLKKHPLQMKSASALINEKVFISFQATTLVNGIQHWLMYEKDDISADQALEFYEFLISHSILDIVDTHTRENIKNRLSF